MRFAISISISILLTACGGDDGGPGDDAGDDAGFDAAGVDAAVCAPGGRDCGASRCTLGSTDCCTGACTSCDWLGVPEPPPAAAGDTCSISDWEHDFSCRFVEPEATWQCCGSGVTTGVFCSYGTCSSELGAPCCEGDPTGDPYVCVDGRWAEPL